MITIESVDARVTRVQTRLPFRYGIAEMTAAPHVVVEVVVTDERSGQHTTQRGWASENLPPKWFTKDPTTLFSDDLVGLVAVIEHAVDRARGLRAPSAFALWKALDEEQTRWAARESVPGLLAGLGTALVERAVIDAVCRGAGIPFIEALHTGVLGFEPAVLHPELEADGWHELLPRRLPDSIAVRHTVGLGDPLVAAEAVDRPADSLPVSLAEILEFYGVDHLKVKTAGDAESDRRRLSSIFEVCDREGVVPVMTIDGNESMRDAEHLRRWVEGLFTDDELGRRLRGCVLAVEQPVHRDAAFAPALAPVLRDLADRGVAVIIDESDESVDAVRRAMDLGYSGGTYKGCKGVFRGLANAALAAQRARSGARTLMTAEDLSTLPPLTVPQDLVVASAMGLTHIERNGHHYFARFAALSPGVEEDALAAHPDLYRRDGDVVRLRVEGGCASLRSAAAAPFAFAPELTISGLQPLSLGTARSLA